MGFWRRSGVTLQVEWVGMGVGMGPGEALEWPWPHAGQITGVGGPRDKWELDLRAAENRRERSLCPVGTRSSWGKGAGADRAS